jgi:murein DD-endopeptidase MepM/ murein hydrolase activator NlpD
MIRLWGSVLALPALLVVLAAQADAGSGVAPAAPTHAVAYGVKVLLPNEAPIVGGFVDAASTGTSAPTAFAYPADGSVVRIGSVAGRSSATSATARARSDVQSVSLFDGEITVDALVAASTTSVASSVADGGFDPSSVSGLVALGQSISPAPNLRVPLGDWGHLTLLQERAVSPRDTSRRGWVTVLDVQLDADHAALPVGTRILVGYAESSGERRVVVKARETDQKTPAASQGEAPGALPSPTSVQTPVAPHATRPRITRGLGYPADVPRPGTLGPSPLVLAAPPVIKRLTAAGYVFPVYGTAGWGDSFGAPRADVSWHHGVDIFAPLGAPVLAVADGTLFSVGRNRLGGNRLWLRDRSGNEFYFAHLSAYSPLAVNDARVRAGDVIGFVGNTGDADSTPYHLHFEIHPASMLFLGYDGVVNPTPYLRAWQRVKDVDFPSAAVWVPNLVATGKAPLPGAILLQASDISTANGLDPGSLADALTPAPAGGEGAVALPSGARRGTAPDATTRR